ncbi:MAG: threonine/serine dehydratase [Gemmatimonadota bacterium]
MTGPTLDDLSEAAAGLAGIAVRTPLLPLEGLLPGVEVRLKAEHLQPIGAFKIRGAWTAIRRLPAEQRARGVVTSSSGNHGLGIAFAANRHGIPAIVVMPESAPAIKVAGIRDLGAEVVQIGKVRGPEQGEEAARLVTERGMTMIPPYDHPDVMAGQGTCGLEILEQWPEVTAIVVPVGGGGLLAGICAAVRALRPDVRVIAVEPTGVPKLSTALRMNHPETLPGGTSLADGLLTRSVGELTWPGIKSTVSEVVDVTDDDITAAMKWLAARGIRVEPSGAVTTAALLASRIRPPGPTVVVASGGNVDPARYDALVR